MILSYPGVFCGVLRIPLSEDDLAPFDLKLSSVVFATLGMLRERGLLAVPLSRWAWRAEFKRTGIYGQDWLPFYEAVRRGWTSDKAMIRSVAADPIFNKMLDAKVTFLEDRVFDAAQINITRRIFRKARDPHDKSRNDSVSFVPDDDESGEDDWMDKLEDLVIDYD